MPYSSEGYKARAEECVKLASYTEDEMLRGAILRLRQTYLEMAKRLAQMESREHSYKS